MTNQQPTEAQIEAKIKLNNRRRGHKLMTKEVEKTLSALYATDGQGDDVVVKVKYFTAWGNWTWYAWEYDPETRELFGYTVGDFPELGYISLTELEFITDGMGLPIERDLYFTPKTLKEVKASHGIG